MAADAENTQRLAKEIDDRRIHLRLQWDEVASRAGISVPHLRRIRNGQARISPIVARGLEETLGWRNGSIQAILGGGRPTPIDDRSGTATVRLSDEAISRDDLTVHITDEPEPSTPPGTPEGFSDGPLGTRERVIWDGDEPWQRRWGAIQLIRGGTTPLLRGRQDRSQDQGEGKRRGA